MNFIKCSISILLIFSFLVFLVDYSEIHLSLNIFGKTASSSSLLDYQSSLLETSSVENEIDKMRLLCWVMHRNGSLDKRQAIMDTWGRRCTVLLFVVGRRLNSSDDNDEPQIVELSGGDKEVSLVVFNMNDTYKNLWTKTKLTFSFIVKKYANRFDWAYKADDDSYVIVENLKRFLASRNISDPHYFGCQYKKHGGYNSGGSGYAVSNVVARMFVSALNTSRCRQLVDGSEDVNVGRCLNSVNVTPADTRDEAGRYRFISISMRDVLAAERKRSFFYQYIKHPINRGLECCSDSPIAFHYVNARDMRLLEYLIYFIKKPTSKMKRLRR